MTDRPPTPPCLQRRCVRGRVAHTRRRRANTLAPATSAVMLARTPGDLPAPRHRSHTHEVAGRCLGKTAASLTLDGAHLRRAPRIDASVEEDGAVVLSVELTGLELALDYPERFGTQRRIKQISVTLPAVLGAYQDVQAALEYTGEETPPRGCRAVAISRGMNDSGLFQLDFNDGKFLPFEGLAIDSGGLALTFPNALGKQKAVLESLNDVILQIAYTIRP